MNKESKEFLYELINTPSPTGYEENIQKIVRERMSQYSDNIKTDLHGNVMVGLNTTAKRRVMLAGHCDQIGMMVKHITIEGYIYFSALGGIDTGVLQGASINIHSEKGIIPGVIGRKAIHLQTPDERNKATLDIEKMWIDVGAKNKKELDKKVKIGDPITFKNGITEFNDDLICSPGLDDKVGLFVAMEALKICSKQKLNVALYSVSTVQEEIGCRGAQTASYTIDPEVGIAIDVYHAFDNPASENKKTSPSKLGGGPLVMKGPNINPALFRYLESSAKKKKIPIQIYPSSSLISNDASKIQVSRGSVATGSIGIPNRYMHTQVEVCSLNDIENAAKLLASFVAGINDKTDFIP